MRFGVVQCVLIMYLVKSACAKSVSWKTYTSPSPVFKILYSKDSNILTVGGRNRLFQLDQNLTPIREVRTGPAEDSPNCPPYPIPCAGRIQTDNDVKIMHFLGENSTLVCGSVDQGMCNLYWRENITAYNVSLGSKEDIASYVAGNGTVVSFVENNRELYVARSYDDRDTRFFDSTISPKIIELRRERMSDFQFSFHGALPDMGLRIRPFLIGQQINYMYGFSYKDHIYFLLTKQSRSQRYTTLLARVCDSDNFFFSYSEVEVECRNRRGTKYNLAVTGFLGPSFNLTKDVLYAVFGRNDAGREPLGRFGSAYCMFPMSRIEEAFDKQSRGCSRVSSQAKQMKYLGEENKCVQKLPSNHKEVLCYPGVNQMESTKGDFLASTIEMASSIAVTSQRSVPVAFLGSTSGTIIKAVMTDEREFEKIYKVAVNPETGWPGQEVRSSYAFDENEENLYLLSGNKVIKFPAGSCLPHPNNETCTLSKDPLECVWCEDHCSNESDCQLINSAENHVQPVVQKWINLFLEVVSTLRSAVMSRYNE